MALPLSKRVSGTKGYYNLIRRVAFPRSTTIIVAISFVFATVGLGLSFLIVQKTAMSFLVGVSWGIAILILPSVVSDVGLYLTIMKRDPLFYLRRCLAFSLFTIILWVIVFFLCSIVAVGVPEFTFPDFAVVVGLFAVMPLRSIVVFSMSETSFARRMLFTLMEPCLTAAAVVLIFRTPIETVSVGLILSSLAGLSFAFAFISFVERDGRRTVGFSPIRMFRALLNDLLESKNEELEGYLNELGVETELSIAEVVFRKRTDHAVKAIMLVSNFHPGPFKNVGSSVLPYLFPAIIRKRFGALGVVPHGVSGHQLNLVSQEQNERIIEWALMNLDKAEQKEKATPVKRTRNEMATATSQVFDGCALVTMTTAPWNMEDIPTEVASRITGEAGSSFGHIALIDAHNCLGEETTLTPEQLRALEEAALASLHSVRDGGNEFFRVGVGHRAPPFTLSDGFGPAGIAVIGVEVNAQRFAYIVIDGNNMQRGLRDDILAAARNVGFEDAEVMTTDTHMVNGIVSAPLGYHVLGEAVPKEAFLGEISLACRTAIEDLEPGEVGAVSGRIRVTTLGSKSLGRVMGLVYRIAKLTALTLFPMVVALAALCLVFLV